MDNSVHTPGSEPPKKISLSKNERESLGERIISAVNSQRDALPLLQPILDAKCPFRQLDDIGAYIGKGLIDRLDVLFGLCDTIVEYNAMGGFVIVGHALLEGLPYRFDTVMEKSREYIIQGDIWYVCDIIGERSIGHAVVNYFDKSLPWLKTFLEDENTWVKRSSGVAIHFFSKRVLDEPEKTKILLEVIEPYLEEKHINVVKGIGWGLKTIGRHHPDLLVEFMEKQKGRDMSKVLVRKAFTYVDKEN
ncbi:MAG: DNA alkylation repair protein [Candidatus Methanofastidiosia archaeon]